MSYIALIQMKRFEQVLNSIYGKSNYQKGTGMKKHNWQNFPGQGYDHCSKCDLCRSVGKEGEPVWFFYVYDTWGRSIVKEEGDCPFTKPLSTVYEVDCDRCEHLRTCPIVAGDFYSSFKCPHKKKHQPEQPIPKTST